MPIAIDLAFRFAEVGESLVRQRSQRRPLDLLEDLQHLLLGRAVNPRIRDCSLPVRQVLLLLLEARELVAF
jgi:hypothetical protein